MTTVDGKTSWDFAKRTSGIPSWRFMTKYGEAVQEPVVTNREKMAMYEKECPASEEHKVLISDLCTTLQIFASYEKQVENHRQPKRKSGVSVLAFEEMLRSGQILPDGCSGRGDNQELTNELAEYDKKNLGVPLAITIPNWVTFGEVAPRRIDQDRSSQNTDIFKYEDFMTLMRALRINGMLCDQCWLEPIFAEKSDQVIARRIVVVVMSSSAGLLAIYDGDEDEEDSDGENGEDVGEEDATYGQNEEDAGDDGANHCDRC